MQLRNDGVMALFIGVSRSGKSTPIKMMLGKARRVLVFDSKGEYGALGLKVIRTLPELLETLRCCSGNGRFAYVPSGYSKQEFNSFCRLAHIWNKQAPCLIVVEELAAVTNCGKAFGYWGVLVNQSLGLGATLLATVQRGQEVDKSIMNNATYLYVCQHNTESDVKYVAGKLGVSIDKIPREPLRFIVWTPVKSLVTQGICEYRKNGKRVTTVTAGAKPVLFALAGNKRKRLTPSNTLGLLNNIQYR